MAIKAVRTHLDFQGHVSQNMAIHPSSNAPSTHTVGQVYFNVNENVLKLYHEGSWNDLATRKYVDYRPQVKDPVDLVSSVNISLSNPETTIDSQTLVSGNKVLLINQDNKVENGIYSYNGTSLIRSSDSISGSQLLPGCLITVKSGADYEGTLWAVTNLSEVELDVDPLLITQVGGSNDLIPIEKGGTNNTTFVDQKILIYNETENAIVSSAFTLNSLTKTIAFDVTGPETNFTLTHNLSTLDFIVQVYDKSTGETIEAQTIRQSPNTLLVSFNQAPTLNTFRVLVQGNGIIIDPGIVGIDGGDAED
jgi:hypothetical protein